MFLSLNEKGSDLDLIDLLFVMFSSMKYCSFSDPNQSSSLAYYFDEAV